MPSVAGRAEVLRALQAALAAAEAHHPGGLDEPYFCRACGAALADFDAVCPGLARAALAAAIATDTHAAHPADDDVTLITSGEWPSATGRGRWSSATAPTRRTRTSPRTGPRRSSSATARSARCSPTTTPRART